MEKKKKRKKPLIFDNPKKPGFFSFWIKIIVEIEYRWSGWLDTGRLYGYMFGCWSMRTAGHSPDRKYRDYTLQLN